MWVNSYNDESYTNSPLYKYKGNTIPSTDILHFKHFTRDGRLGISLISNHAETIGSAKKLRKFANRSISSTPPVYATTNAIIPSSTTAKDQLKTYLAQEVAGWFNRGEIPFLSNGFDLKTVGMSPKDAQYLDQISATKEDIFSIFKTPPGLIGSYKTGVTYSNMEQQDLQWRAYGLTPLLKMIEEEFNEKLYTETEQESRFVKFNVKALLLTDHNAQSNWFKTMFGIGVYSINEIRDLLDQNPIEDGDDHYVPVNNLMPVDMVEDFLTNQEEAQPGDMATDLATGEKDGQEKEAKKRVRKYSIDELLKRKAITINVNGHAVEE
jgi:HK97 family phage portal protein